MPVVGFRDSNDEAVTFERVLRGEGTFLTPTGQTIPGPLVRSLARQYRAPDHYGDASIVSVTQLIAPAQQQRLLQRHRVFVYPLDNLWAAYGTLMHLMLERAGEADGALFEQRFTAEFDGITLAGTTDVLERAGYGSPHDGDWVGTDYKVTSVWGVRAMVRDGVYKGKEDYYWQAQLYALLARRAGYDVRGWSICAISRDWTKKNGAGSTPVGPVEIIDVPLLAEARVLNYLNQRLMVWKAAALAEDSGLPQCTDEETWGGRRCADYCPVAGVCHQINPGLSDA